MLKSGVWEKRVSDRASDFSDKAPKQLSGEECLLSHAPVVTPLSMAISGEVNWQFEGSDYDKIVLCKG